jgi:hypothetical protein
VRIAKIIIRVAAALAALGCVLASLKLIGQIFVYGMVIGDWTGLPAYKQAIKATGAKMNTSLLQFLAVQLLGGVLTCVAAAKARRMAWYPLFGAAFFGGTLLVAVSVVLATSATHAR